jgi:integrase/recombinase XerD
MVTAGAIDDLDAALAEHQSWLTVERGLARNTLLAYRRDLRHYADYLREQGILGVAGVGERQVMAYVDVLRAARDDEGRPRWSPASIARALVAVRSFHRFCADEGLVLADPSEAVRGPRVGAGIPKALSEPEVDALLGAVTGDAPAARRDRAILETLYASGMRISELVGLDRADLDLDGGLVRAFGKGSKERIVPIGRMAREAVFDYLTEARPVLAGARPRRAGDAVFLNVRGTRLSRQGCWSIVKAAAGRVGLAERVSPHVLRHSCATHLLDHGADIRVVQEVLGHASLSTTQVYTKVSADRLRAVYDAAHPRSRSRR